MTQGAVPVPGPGFLAFAHPGLLRRGLAGKRIEVRMGKGVLQICGEEGTEFEVPASSVDRLRFGVSGTERHGPWYIAHLLLAGEQEPLILRSSESGAPGYADTMRRFAACVAETRGVGRVELGLSKTLAAVTWTGAGFIAFICLIMVAAFGRQSPGLAWTFSLFGAFVLSTVLFGQFKAGLGAPRAVKSLEAIERYLPKSR
ncbi:MAG: hypothetical protein AB7F98_06060 [Novosphingobium sp.]